jgi:hypothetical protein
MLVLLLVLVACILPAEGKVLLKPTGASAYPLRTKTVAARVVVEGQVAATEMVLLFANESDERIEADFLYELPPHAVPTYFAYWFGEEKVVARIAEKERAQEIYQYITSRMRDPALVEMVDERTLRARIFPVMANSDLRVEVHFVQAVPSEPDSTAVYTLPLEQPEGETLEQIDVTVRVKGRPDLVKVTNNYGLSVEEHDGDTLVTIAGRNYRPPKDLRVRQEFTAAQLVTSLYAAPSGGPDGFFALALTPAESLRKPKIQISGVSTYQTTPLPSSVQAHEALFLYGRYRGSGPATVTLSGQGASGIQRVSAGVHFYAQAAPNNPATRLWAAQRMAELSAGGNNVDTVTAMSKRFNIPSKYTSWIAIPQEERERYAREQAETEAAVLARRLAPMIIQGQGSTRQAKALRAQLDAKCKLFDGRAEDLLHNGLHTHIDLLAGQLVWMIQRGKEQTREARRIRRELNSLAKHTGQSVEGLLRWQIRSSVYSLAKELVAEQHKAMPDAQAVQRIRNELYRLTRSTGERPEDYIKYAERPWARQQAEEVRARYISEMQKSAPDPERVEALRVHLLRLYTKSEASAELAHVRVERITARTTAERLERRIIQLQEADTPVPEILQTQVSHQRQRERQLSVRMGDPLISVEAPADARSVIALMPNGEVKPLQWNSRRTRWEARFDVPAYAQSGEYRITIIAVLKDGTRQTMIMPYTVDVTPPTGTATARVVQQPAGALRVEVQASEDTARVTAILPWDSRVDLTQTAPGRYFALIPMPERQEGPICVEIILTDQAHNRSTLTAQAKGE